MSLDALSLALYLWALSLGPAVSSQHPQPRQRLNLCGSKGQGHQIKVPCKWQLCSNLISCHPKARPPWLIPRLLTSQEQLSGVQLQGCPRSVLHSALSSQPHFRDIQALHSLFKSQILLTPFTGTIFHGLPPRKTPSPHFLPLSQAVTVCHVDSALQAPKLFCLAFLCCPIYVPQAQPTNLQDPSCHVNLGSERRTECDTTVTILASVGDRAEPGSLLLLLVHTHCSQKAGIRVQEGAVR